MKFHLSKPILIISLFTIVLGLVLIVQAQETMEGTGFKLRNLYLEIQETPYPQNIPLVEKEGQEEKIVGKAKIVDQYLISNLSEDKTAGE